MKNILLKFCFAVEIGAYLAYVGHYNRTLDGNIKNIYYDELRHIAQLEQILLKRDSKPSYILNFIFNKIGKLIQIMCKFCPIFMLNKVAQIMELFNIFSYSTMAKLLPEYKDIFLEMQKNEEEHSAYFA